MIKKSEFCILSSFIIRAIFFGGSMYAMLSLSKQDNWLSVIIGYLIGFIPLIIYYFLLSHDAKLNIVGLTNKYFGKIGKIINLTLTGFVMFFGSLALWNLTNFISTQYLYLTPLLAIAIVFMIGIFYITSKGLRTIGRTGTILFMMNISLFLLALLSLGSKLEISNFTPIFETNFSSIVGGGIVSVMFNIVPLFMLLIIPKDNIENNKKLVKNFIIIYTVTMISVLLVVITVTGIFGIDLAMLYQYPEYHVLKSINIANFFQRVETILSIQWVFDGIMCITFCLYYVKTSFMENFKIEKHPTLTVFIITVLMIIISRIIFSNNTVAEIFAIKVFPYLSGLFFLIIPLFILLVVKIRKKSF